MVNKMYTLVLIIIMGLVTLTLRALPALVFSKTKSVPKIILYLGDVLPASAIGMLVVYCLKDLDFTANYFGLLELGSCLVVVIVQVIKRNSILSILAGTICYMILVNIF